MTRLHVPVPVRWSDLDAYEHVNNARMLTLLEEARIAAFWSDQAGGAPTAVPHRCTMGDSRILRYLCRVTGCVLASLI